MHNVVVDDDDVESVLMLGTDVDVDNINVKNWPVRHAGRWVDWGVEGEGLLIPDDDKDDVDVGDGDDDAFFCDL